MNEWIKRNIWKLVVVSQSLMPGKIPEQMLKDLIQKHLEDNLVTDLSAFTETRPNLTLQHFFFSNYIYTH